jgi:hypothetical protein
MGEVQNPSFEGVLMEKRAGIVGLALILSLASAAFAQTQVPVRIPDGR